ncbi:uncharacterized protein C8orf74 homolog [Dasypus novemcinctus]|uniref:uncharacterized protein C8orf74 homolog n=1 Tax=Dasypus novemcinctus TaxID=9361 RepID=UPI00265F5C18|nr:uncharacterized protein C8orf74 homolog [Dasypus novemcinctus]
MALLTARGAREVLQLQKPEGREHLRRLLRWEERDELREPRRDILLDALYESVVFAGGQGFPWRGVAQVARVTEELLQETKGCALAEAVAILGHKLSGCRGLFRPGHLLALCDYLLHTFIRHYKLYQYVLARDQDVQATVARLEVCVPPVPLPLAQGVDAELWRHEQQVAALSTAAEQKRHDLLLVREALRLRQERELRAALERRSPASGRALTAQELEELVGEALGAQTAGLRELLQRQVEATFDILDLTLRKKTLRLNPPAALPPVAPGQPGPEESAKPRKISKEKRAKK